MKPSYGLQVVGHSAKGNAYLLQVATVPIRHRGDTLKGPVLGVTARSPTEGVIGVRIEHLKVWPFLFEKLSIHVVSMNQSQRTDASPEIALFPEVQASPKSSISQNESNFAVSSGDLTAEIPSKPYTITFKTPNGTLANVGVKRQAVIDVPYK